MSTLDDLATVAEHQKAAARKPAIAGDRVVGPGANTSTTAAALVAAADALTRSGYEPRLGNAGSANLRVPLGRGAPAIGVGGERGGQRGFADEWADIPQMMRTARFVVLLAATMGM